MTIRRNGVSVPEAVKEILTRNYPVYQCLKMKLLNYHALAQHIQTQVQEATGHETSINTLVVAIKRFSDTLDKTQMGTTPSKLLKSARISLSSGIVDVTMKTRKSLFSKILRDVADIGSELSEFPHVFPLATSIKMILPADDYDIVKKKLGDFGNLETREGVAKLTLYLAPSAEMTPGIGSYITELLYRNGINVLDAFLGYGDIIMVVNGEDGPPAFNILQKEISQVE